MQEAQWKIQDRPPIEGSAAKLPNSYPLAKQRLESLERSLSKNPGKAARYNTAIREYEINRWAQRLTESEIKNTKGPVYYLPHQPDRSHIDQRKGVHHYELYLIQHVSIKEFR